jgi:hypothetical protein
MPWMMRRSTFDFFPAVKCDHCGGEFDRASQGYVAWNVDILADPRDEPVTILCSESCLNYISESEDETDSGEWIATPFSVYIANLAVGLGIDVDEVIETEQASVAAENTRDQAPD